MTGILNPIPSNSHLQFDFIASFASVKPWLGEKRVNNWRTTLGHVYVLLPERHSLPAMEQKLVGFIENATGEPSLVTWRLFLQPLTRIHLFSQSDYGLAGASDIVYVYILAVIALFLLLIACINFMNLSTALSMTRFREVGMRKALGANNASLLPLFLSEALLVSTMSTCIALAMVKLVLPELNLFIDRTLTLDFSLPVFLGLTAIVIFSGLVSGCYPAFILLASQPNEAIIGASKSHIGGKSFRNSLVVFQFAVSIALMICTTFTMKQLNYMQNEQLGFNKDAVLVVPIRDGKLRKNPSLAKKALLQNPAISQASAAALYPGGPVGRMAFRYKNNRETEERTALQVLWVDHDFLQTLSINLLTGRDFSTAHLTDATQAYILNETAVKHLGWDPQSAIGKSFERMTGSASGPIQGRIIGVVKDFHFQSMHRAIEPLVIHVWPWPHYILVRFRPGGNPLTTVDFIKEKLQELDPAHPFEYAFLDDNLNRRYQDEERMAQLAVWLTSLAIFVACLGLFGLVSLSVQQRAGEVGIRKVLGGTVSRIAILLMQDYLRLVLIANLVAWPIAYLAVQGWLEGFAYRIKIEFSVFFLSCILSLSLAVFTMLYKAIKTANKNPVDVLGHN